MHVAPHSAKVTKRFAGVRAGKEATQVGTSPVSWFPQVLRDLQHSEDDWGVLCCTGKSLRSDEEELESGLMRHASSRKQGTYVSIVRAEYPLGIEPVSRLLLTRKPLQFVYTT